MESKPFALWVLFGGLLYVGVAVLALLVQMAAAGILPLTDPTVFPFLIIAVLFVVAGVVSLTGKAWSLILTTVLTLVFLLLIVPFSAATLANPADPTFWVFISGIPILVLLVLFAILSWLNVKTGIANKPYLASPRSAGGLLTVAVVGFAVGGVLVGNIAGGLIARGLAGGGEAADVLIVTDASNQQTPEAYMPATLTVPRGTEVTWFNQDLLIHTVTSETGLFDSRDLGPGGTFSYNFTEPGTYRYFCIPHPWMQGEVIVT
ncbi:MAG: plastocyanin/azurin family copper-binding protein [Thermoplasmata archaeon]